VVLKVPDALSDGMVAGINCAFATVMCGLDVRANRFGLTTRQLEMLSLLAEGLTNAEIAGRLSIAPKTAEHHVAAVLAKLDVSSRQAAVRLARGQQLISER
jgi:DNA-binding CsgD family transcriptional regulator